MELCAYLNFNGNCAEAFKFYEQTLGGTIEFIQTHGESPIPEHCAPDWLASWKDKVMHVCMKIGNRRLMGSDAPPQYFATPQGFGVSLSVKTSDEARRIFEALSENGKVSMPFQKTFWSPGFGMATDRFGTPWIINTEVATAQ
jgi:PhnB protein